MDIKRVGDHECIQCGECIAVCPTKAISWKGQKLFVHENAVGAPAEEKPLNALLKQENAVAEDSSSGSGAALAAEAAQISEQNFAATRAKQQKRNFWLQFTAWFAALALLAGALVYYNFIDKNDVSAVQVGDICPTFTVQTYGEENGEYKLTDRTYSPADSHGKVTVINFWATWCGPCVAELPYFEQLQNTYPENIQVVAVQGKADRDVVKFITEEKQWQDYSLLFAQDIVKGATCEVYKLLGGSSTFPYTIVLNKEGVIVYHSSQSLTFEKLDKIVAPYLN